MVASDPPLRGSHLWRSAIRTGRAIWGFVLVLAAWELLHFMMKSAALPSPIAAAAELWRLLGRGMAPHLAASLTRILLAIAIQLGFGLGFGIWLGLCPRADSVLGPSVYALYPVPKIALLPLFMILFGLGELSKVLFVAAVLVFQTIVTARDGVREIPAQVFLAARSLGLSRRALYRHVIGPALAPRILTSLRLGVGTGMAVLFFAENYATRYGVGYFIMSSYAMADYRATFAGILALSLLGFALFAAIDAADRRFCAWTKAGSQGRTVL